jgi:hypothetical protein
MGTTRTEQAIDDFDPLGEDGDISCDDIRLAWLADELRADQGDEFESLWADR